MRDQPKQMPPKGESPGAAAERGRTREGEDTGGGEHVTQKGMRMRMHERERTGERERKHKNVTHTNTLNKRQRNWADQKSGPALGK